MFQKELLRPGENIDIPESFSGFVVFYEDGTVEFEREGYYSERTHRFMATSWPEVDLNRLTKVDLYWHGQLKTSLSKTEHPHMGPSDWFFSQTGYMDVQRHGVRVVARNIGYRGKDGCLYVTSVNDFDGSIKGSIRV